VERLLRYDHYKVLGVPRDATAGQIRHAYRAQVKRCHPDRNPSPRAATHFQAVHTAWTVLRDPGQRRHYDERLQYYREASSNPVTGSASRDPRYRRGAATTSSMGQPVPPPLPVFLFRALHATGLLFGLSTIAVILIGFTFFDWSPLTLVVCLPGMAAIPESWDGLFG